jgi:cytochrome c
MRRSLAAALLATVSCTATPRRSVPPVDGHAPRTSRGEAAADTTAYTTRLARGRQTVETVCAACHSVAMPPKAAPPLRMVAMHYRRSAGDSAVAAIAAYVRSPAAERSALPPGVIRRFGLMPALALPDSQLRDAAAYILSLPGGGSMMGDSAAYRGMRGTGTMHRRPTTGRLR